MSRNNNKTKKQSKDDVIDWTDVLGPREMIRTQAARLFNEDYMSECIRHLPADCRWKAYTALLAPFYDSSTYASEASYVTTSPFFVNVTLNGGTYALPYWLGNEQVNDVSKPSEERRGIVMSNFHFPYFLQRMDAILEGYSLGTKPSGSDDKGYPDDLDGIVDQARLMENFRYGIRPGDLYDAYPFGVHVIAAPTGGGKSTFIEHYLTSLGKLPSIKAPTLPFESTTLDGKSGGVAEVFNPLINWGEPTALATPFIDQLAKILTKTLVCSEYAIVDSVSKLLLSIDKNIGAGGLSKSIRTMAEELTTFCEMSNRKLFLTVNPLDPDPRVYSVLLDLMAGGATSITLADIPKSMSVYISNRSAYNPLSSSSDDEDGVLYAAADPNVPDRTENDRFWKKVEYGSDRRKSGASSFQVKEALVPLTIPKMIDYISSGSNTSGWVTTDPKILSALSLTSNLAEQAEKLRFIR